MKEQSILLVLILVSTLSFGQVLNTSDSQVQGFLDSENVEMSPLANFFSKRTPMMDILHALIKDDDGLTRTYVGAEVGSAYENETFLPGKVYYNDEELGDVFYRLNAYNNEIEIKKSLKDEEKQLALIKNQEVKMVAPNVALQYMKYYDGKDNLTEGYLALLKEGNRYTLYRRLLKKFTEPKAAENSMVNSTPSRFTDYTEYYFKENNADVITELPIQKRRLGKLFPEHHAKSILEYFKNNKPNAEVETEVLLLFDFIDSLE